MKRLLYWLGVVDLVWSETVSGRLLLRVVWHDQSGARYVYGHCGPTTSDNVARLCEGGTFDAPSALVYMERWYPYDQKPNRRPSLSPFRRTAMTPAPDPEPPR